MKVLEDRLAEIRSSLEKYLNDRTGTIPSSMTLAFYNNLDLLKKVSPRSDLISIMEAVAKDLSLHSPQDRKIEDDF